MPDEIRLSSTSEPESDDQPIAAEQEIKNCGLTRSHIVSFCAVGLIICFFLPWFNAFLARPSGWDFVKDGGSSVTLCLLPLFCGLTILTGIVNHAQDLFARFTGMLPFFLLGFGIYHEGSALLRALDIGAYAGLALGFALIIIPRSMKQH